MASRTVLFGLSFLASTDAQFMQPGLHTIQGEHSVGGASRGAFAGRALVFSGASTHHLSGYPATSYEADQDQEMVVRLHECTISGCHEGQVFGFRFQKGSSGGASGGASGGTSGGNTSDTSGDTGGQTSAAVRAGAIGVPGLLGLVCAGLGVTGAMPPQLAAAASVLLLGVSGAVATTYSVPADSQGSYMVKSASRGYGSRTTTASFQLQSDATFTITPTSWMAATTGLGSLTGTVTQVGAGIVPLPYTQITGLTDASNVEFTADSASIMGETVISISAFDADPYGAFVTIYSGGSTTTYPQFCFTTSAGTKTITYMTTYGAGGCGTTRHVVELRDGCTRSGSVVATYADGPEGTCQTMVAATSFASIARPWSHWLILTAGLVVAMF